ncbi:hypothetical protein FACS1894147_12470 [Spirochaetia bacterium]|nr:hypothetical protein FACS1894147_12470 [Spirochaetia bacterium]
MKRNRFFVQAALRAAGVLAMVLAFGLVLAGCATLKMDKASVIEENVTLESTDVKALGAEWGYAEEISRSAFGPYIAKASPEYPAALVSKFTAVDKDTGTREGVWIQSKISKPMWEVQQHIVWKDAETRQLLEVFDTEREATAFAEQKKKDDPAMAFSFEVVPTNSVKEYVYVGLKPLQ